MHASYDPLTNTQLAHFASLSPSATLSYNFSALNFLPRLADSQHRCVMPGCFAELTIDDKSAFAKWDRPGRFACERIVEISRVFTAIQSSRPARCGRAESPHY